MAGTSGDYKVEFIPSVNEVNQFAIWVNGVAIPEAAFGSGTASQQTVGAAILTLAAGDVITLRNHTSSGQMGLPYLVGGTTKAVNAFLMVTRLN